MMVPCHWTTISAATPSARLSWVNGVAVSCFQIAGKHAAQMMFLPETMKHNGPEPHAWLMDVLKFSADMICGATGRIIAS